MTTKRLALVLVGGGLGFVMVLLKPLHYDYDLPWAWAAIGAAIGATIGWYASGFLPKERK